MGIALLACDCDTRQNITRAPGSMGADHLLLSVLQVATMIRIIAALALVAIIPLASCDVLEKAEELAIEYCDSDGNGCLTWDEVQNCVASFRDYLKASNIPEPTKEMFIAMAHEENGEPCLSFEDWKKANPQA